MPYPTPTPDATPVLNAVRAHPDAATSVVICAEDVVKHWRRSHEALSMADAAEHMTRLAMLLARLAEALDAMRAGETMPARDDDSAEFEADMNLGRLKLL